jgi:hypothetical protein
LLKFAALQRWPQLESSHRFALLKEVKHTWVYRGQVIPQNKLVEVEAVITKIREAPVPGLHAEGYLKVDGLYIYKMDDFGIQLVPI